MSQRLGTVTQDPDERIRYTFDWSAQLSTGDTIGTSTWTYGGGSSSGAAASSTTTATSAAVYGTSGKEYAVENTVTTTPSGEVLQAHIVVRIC